MYKNPFTRIRLGAVYLILQERPIKRVRKDLEVLKANGLDTIVIWPAVSRWDNNFSGETQFESIDRVLDICDELGIKVIVELLGQITDGEYLPEYLQTDEMWVVGQNAHSRNARRTNYNHPGLAQLILEYIAAVVKHNKGRKCIIAYDVFNEIRYWSEDAYTLKKFQDWLRKRYDNNITELNRVWKQYYRSFTEISFDKIGGSAWVTVRPSVDKGTFFTENLGEHLTKWRDEVRKHDPDIPVVIDTGFTSTFGDCEYRSDNDFLMAEIADIPGLSYYPNSWGDAFWKNPSIISANYSVLLSAAPDKPVMMSELQVHFEKLFAVDSCVRPQQLYLWSMLALIQGMQGIIYWKWDPFRGGTQCSGRGLVDSECEPTERLLALRPMADYIAKKGNLFEKMVRSRFEVGIFYDRENELFINRFAASHVSANTERRDIRMKSAYGWYNFFYDQGHLAGLYNINTFEKYGDRVKILVLPAQIVMDDRLDKALRKFLERGGTLILEPRFGIISGEGLLHDTCPGYGWDKILGLKEHDVSEPEGDEPNASDIIQILKSVSSKHKVLSHIKEGGKPFCYEINAGKGKVFYFTSIAGKVYSKNKPALDILKPWVYKTLNIAAGKEKGTAPRIEGIKTGDRCLATLIHDKQGKTYLCLFNFDLKGDDIEVEFTREIKKLRLEYGFDYQPDIQGSSISASMPAETMAIYEIV
jgi:beta-galactosidase GanA